MEQEKKKPARRSKGEGSLIKLKGCDMWYARYYDANGRRIQFATKTPVKQVAQGLLINAMADVNRGAAPLSDVKKITYSQLRAGLLASYVEKGNKSLTEDADGSERIPGLKPLDQFFDWSDGKRGPSVMHITTDTAREFVRKRQAEGMGNAIINRSLAALRRMLRIAREDKKIQNVPVIHLLKEPPARKGFLLTEKFKILSEKLPASLRPLITFLYFCGVRLGEARAIEWTQVDLKARLIRLEDEQTKIGEARIVPLPEALAKMLDKIKPKEGKVFDATNLSKEWHQACAACRLGSIIEVEGKPYDPRYEGLTIHDLRRSAIRNLVNAGVPERVAMRISGHKTRAVFDRYHIVNTDDVTAAMRQVEAANLGKVWVKRGKGKAVNN